MKIIGCDIDDTSLELAPRWLEWHNAQYGESLTVEQITDWGFHKFTPQGQLIYETLQIAGLYNDIVAVAGALGGLRVLRQSYRVVFITANEQPSLKEKRDCLVRNGLLAEKDARKDTIVALDKTLARVDLLIDDNAENVEQFPGPAILFDKPWNRAWKTPKNKEFPVVRCSSWLTIPSFVDVLFEHADGKAAGKWS